MKCPKCDYIGFEAADRCRNCGYDFSLADRRPLQADLSLRADGSGWPVEDLPLDPRGEADPRGRSGPPRAGREIPAGVPPGGADLPLFAADESDQPVLPVPPPRPPLAVRRTPPAVARPRPPVWYPQPTLDLESAVDEPVQSETGEAVAVDGPDPPGVARRLVAAAIDGLLLFGVDAVVVYFTLQVCRLGPRQFVVLPAGPLLAFLAIVNGGYLWAFTAAGGQTIGKMACGLRAVGRDGGVLPPGRAAARAALSLLSAAPLGAGMLPCLFGRGRRALHDWLVGTAVARVTRR